MPDFDWNAFGIKALEALIPVVTTLLVWAGRKVVTIVPRALIPILAVTVATLLDYLVVYMAGGTFDPLIGAFLGASAVWIREFLNTLQEHGLKA